MATFDVNGTAIYYEDTGGDAPRIPISRIEDLSDAVRPNHRPKSGNSKIANF